MDALAGEVVECDHGLDRRAGRQSTDQFDIAAGGFDVLAKDGEGESAARQWLARNQRRRNGFQAVQQARRHVNPITREELDRVAEVWVDAALRLDDRDLKMMGRIVRSQMRRMEGETAEPVQEAMSRGA